MRTLKVGDRMKWQTVIREITEVRPTGYQWRYPDLPDLCPDGSQNSFASENSDDPFFERWDHTNT